MRFLVTWLSFVFVCVVYQISWSLLGFEASTQPVVDGALWSALALHLHWYLTRTGIF